jgi:hypothetical protein
MKGELLTALATFARLLMGIALLVSTAPGPAERLGGDPWARAGIAMVLFWSCGGKP